jgi:hypothetical protein
MLKIQKRDLNLLSDLSRFGILSSEQIGVLHFNGRHHTLIMRRLGMLVKGGYILRINSLPNNQAAFSLSNNGAKLIQIEPPSRFTNRNTTLHDVTVSEVRIVLERFGLGQNFSSEMEMKKQLHWKLQAAEKSSQQIPDGLFTAKARNLELDQIVAMEVELHAKNHARYRNIVDHYLSKDSVNFVWYFVKSKGIADTILKQYKRAKIKNFGPNFLFTLIDEVTLENESLPVWSADDGKWIKISDLFLTKNRMKKDSPETDMGLGRESETSLGRQAA